MAYQSVFRLQLTNFEGQNVLLHISDTTSGTGTPTFHDLECQSIETKIISDTDSKTGIKGRRIIFKFFPTAIYDLNTFLAGDDNRWLVEQYINSQIKFKGFLVVDDTREAFLDKEVVVIEMTASDSLGLLKDIPFTLPDGSTPKGEYTIIELLSAAFRKTNLDLPINIVWNLFPEQLTDNTTDHAFTFTYVDALMFETEVNKREDCYTVLQKLLPGCFITQENGEWWIVRVEEMDGTDFTYYQFDFDGTYIGPATLTRTKDIGLLDSINPINKDGEILPERKCKSATILNRFNPPRELPCNVNFERGDIIGIISIPGGAAYQVECWTAGKNYVGTPAAATVTPYIRRLFTNGYETERVVVIPSSATGPNWIKAEQIKVNALDKFTFSVDRRLTNGIGGPSGTYRDAVAHIRLYGNDGTYWSLTGQPLGSEVPGDWVQTTSTFTSNNRVIEYVWNASGTDETLWASVNVEAKPVPRGGKIEIYLLQSSYAPTRDTHFTNLNFNYIPIIDGVYQKLSAQTFKVTSADNLRAKVEEEAFIFDSLNPNFKGSLFYFSGGNYLLTTRWYDFRLGTTGALGLEKLGKYLVYDLWNQHNRIIRKFEGSLHGLDSATPATIPGLLDQYTLTANSDHANDKIFAAVSYSHDLKSCKWGQSVFSDVFDTVLGKDYTSPFEHKYTQG